MYRDENGHVHDEDIDLTGMLNAYGKDDELHRKIEEMKKQKQQEANSAPASNQNINPLTGEEYHSSLFQEKRETSGIPDIQADKTMVMPAQKAAQQQDETLVIMNGKKSLYMQQEEKEKEETIGSQMFEDDAYEREDAGKTIISKTGMLDHISSYEENEEDIEEDEQEEDIEEGEEDDKANNRMNKIITYVIIGIIAVALLIGAFFGVRHLLDSFLDSDTPAQTETKPETTENAEPDTAGGQTDTDNNEEEDITDNSSQIASLKKQKETYQSQLDSAKKNLETAKNEQSVAKQNVETLETTFTEAKSEYEAYYTSSGLSALDQLEKEVKDAEKALQEARDKEDQVNIPSLEAAYNSKNEQYKQQLSAIGDINSVEEKYNRLVSEANKVNEQINEQKTKLESANSSVSKYEDQIEELNKKIGDIDEQLSKLES